MLIKVKNYEHYNRALGKYIRSKRHYEQELAKGGFVPIKEGEKLAQKARQNNHKKYEPSEKLLDIVRSAKAVSKNGKIKPSDKLIDAMKEVGVNFNLEHCPKHYQSRGGFDAV